MAAISVGEIEATLTLKDQLSSSLKIATQNLDKMGTTLQQVGTQMRTVGTNMALSVTAPLVAAGTAALKFSSDFQTTMTKVGNLTDIGAEHIGDMKDAILALAPTVGIGPTALGEGLLVIASTGLKGAKALDVLEQSAKASAVGLGETRDIGRAVTSAITAYAKEGLTAAEASNKLFIAVREGGADADQFAGTLGRVVGVAEQMGVSFDEVLASIATFTRLGVNADTATTGLRATIISLLHPSKMAREEFQHLGTSIEEVRKNIKEKGFAAALQDILRLAGGDVDAIGKIIPEARALASVLGTAGVQGAATAEILGKLKEGTTDLDDAFKIASETLGFKWNQALAKAQAVGIQFGDAIAPIFEDVLNAMGPMLDVLGKMAKAFGSLPGPIKAVAVATLAFLAAAGPLAFEIGSLISIAGFLTKAFVFLTSMFAADTVAAVANTAALAGNAAAATANAAATTAAGTALQFAAGEQMAFSFMAKEGAQLLLPLSGAIAGTEAAAAAAAPVLAEAGTSVGLLGAAVDLALGPIGLLVAAGAGILTATGTWGDLGRILKSTAEIIKNVAIQAFDFMIDKIKRLGEAAVKYGTPVISFLDQAFGVSSSIKFFGDTFKTAMDKSATALEGLAAATAKSTLPKDVENAAGAMDKLKAAQFGAMTSGVNMADTMDRGTQLINDQASAAVTLVGELKAAKLEFAKLTTEQRANISAGLEMGKSVHDIAEQMHLGEPAVQMFKDTLASIKDERTEVSKAFMDIAAGVQKLQTVIDEETTKMAVSVNGANFAWERGLELVHAMAGMKLPQLDGRNISGLGTLGPGMNGGPAKIGTAKKGNALDDLFAGVPTAIQAAIQGGGSKLQAAGSAIGASLFGKGSALNTTITNWANKLPGVLGSTLGNAVPVIGALIGPAIAGLTKLLGKSEESAKVSPLRNTFFEAAGGLEVLNANVMKATGNLRLVQDVFDAKTVENYDKAIKNVGAAMEAYGKKVAAVTAEKDKLIERMTHVMELTPELEAAFSTAFDASTPEGFAEAMATINGLLDGQDAKQKELTATMEKYGIAWTDAGAKAKEARLAETANGLHHEFDILREAGVGVFQIMEGMGPAVNDFVKEAKKAGVEIPESFRGVIQAAIDNGKILDDNGDKVKDLKDLGLIFGTTMEESTKKVGEAIERLAKVLEERLAPAIKNIPDGSFTVRGSVQLPERFPQEFQTPNLDGFAGGTHGAFPDFGSGTPVMLHGQERVVTRAEGQQQDAMDARFERLLRMLPRMISVAVQDGVQRA